MKPLLEIKKELREILPEGIDLCLRALKPYLSDSTDKYKDLILLESRYQEVTRRLIQGIVSNEDAQLEFNKIRKDILDFIEGIEENHLKETEAVNPYDGKPDIYNGELLYRIPPEMFIEEEVKCLVRLAFDRKILMEDLEKEDHDVMKDVRISDVMGVELLDPEGEAFQIRSLNDIVQFVEKDFYTEWVFYVKPQKEGKHTLVLKVSVIEMRDGIERRRNVVLEEKVMIVTTPVPEAPDGSAFKSAGYTMQMAMDGVESPTTGGHGEAGEAPKPPTTPNHPSYVVKPEVATPARSGKGNLRKMTATLAGLVVLIGASWAIWTIFNPAPNSSSVADNEKIQRDWKNATDKNTRDAYEEFVNNNPDSELADLARTRLDDIETAFWVTAVRSNAAAAVQEYLDAYPDGQYVKEAQKWLEENGRPSLIPIDTQVTAQPMAPVNNTKREKIPDKPAQNDKNEKPAKNRGTPIQPDQGKKMSLPKKSEPEKDPNAPIPAGEASRMPIYPKCANSNPEKERQCTASSIQKFVRSRLEYPKPAIERKISGTVQVEFVVERDGSISKVRSLNDIGGGCADEAVRLVKRLPKFSPGLDPFGKPVRILYLLPIRFELN